MLVRNISGIRFFNDFMLPGSNHGHEFFYFFRCFFDMSRARPCGKFFDVRFITFLTMPSRIRLAIIHAPDGFVNFGGRFDMRARLSNRSVCR